MTECATNKLIFPALEAFEERLANPTVYYIFYEYFLRAAVGEEEWKRNTGCHHPKPNKRSSTPTTSTTTTTTSPNKRMASSLDEAFALLVLKNNYFAWLLDGKQLYSGLLTDYDSGRNVSQTSSRTLVQYLLNGSIVSLDWEENESYILWKPCDGVITDYNDEYIAAYNKFKAAVQRIREKAKNSLEYKSVTEALKQIRTTNDEDDKGRKKKKRKLIRDLKPYTGVRVGEERAFRGWSERAFVELLDLKKAIAEEKEPYKRFGKSYRRLYTVQRNNDAAVAPVPVASKPALDDEQYKQLFDLKDDTSSDEE